MAGYYTRSLYDECNNHESLNISRGPGMWVANTPQQSNTLCFSSNGPRNTRTGNSSILPIEFPNTVDIESALYGLDVSHSRCMSSQSLVERDAVINKLYNEATKRSAGEECSNLLDLQHTRLEGPGHTTEKSFNRYEYPIIDPREWTFYGFQKNEFSTSTDGSMRDGRSTRYDVKEDLQKKNAELRRSADKFVHLAAINSEL